MAIHKKDVERIESLARLRLNSDNLFEFATRLDKVFAWIDLLKEVDVTEVQPLVSPAESFSSGVSPMRPDKVNKTTSVQDVLANAPDSQYGYFLVPKVVE